MYLVSKSVALLLLAYALVIGGFTLWFVYSRVHSESVLVQETLTLLGREKARELDDAIRGAEDPANLLGDTQLRQKIESVLEASEIVTSITVADADGRVISSDHLPTGSMLPPVDSIFRGKGKPEAYARPLAGLLPHNSNYVLYLPLPHDAEAISGYLQITFQSVRLEHIGDAVVERLTQEAIFGLVFVALSAIVLHVQLSRHAQRLTRYLESTAAADGSSPKLASHVDEFSTVYQAAEKMGQALAEARRHGKGAGERFGHLSDVLRVGILWFHPDKRLEFANHRAFELSGTESMEELQARWRQVAHPIHDVMDQLLESSISRSDAIDVIMGAPLRTLRVQIYRIGAVACEGFIGLVTDPGIIESLEEDVHVASQMVSLGRVCRTVVHELRSPLGAMIVNMDLLRESLSERTATSGHQDADRYIGVVQMEMERLNQTLMEMLNQVAPFSQKQERVNLGVLLVDLAVLLKEQARRQRIELEVAIPEMPFFTLGRRDHLKQAFLNIAVNALEAMPAGGCLKLGLTLADGAANVEICDTGPGLPPGLMERIYEMGYSTKEAGTGMGLYVARTLISQHSGTIRARSGQRRGTCFDIVLPIVNSGTAVPSELAT